MTNQLLQIIANHKIDFDQDFNWKDVEDCFRS